MRRSGRSAGKTRVESGLAALLAATSPVWTVALESAFGGWKRPPLRVLAGVLLGLAGVAVLVAPGEFIGGAHADLAGAGAIGLAAVGWAAASVISHGHTVHPSPEMATAMKMLAGGALLAALGLATGEAAEFHPLAYSAKAWLAWGYLVVFGSLVAFSAFTFLLRVTTPAKVSTSAYVNPLVAVLLGWALLGEAISPRTLLAALVIIAGVVLVRLAGEEPAEP